jgi:hypothetical protein
LAVLEGLFLRPGERPRYCRGQLKTIQREITTKEGNLGWKSGGADVTKRKGYSA